jgi:hypothetical protein
VKPDVNRQNVLTKGPRRTPAPTAPAAGENNVSSLLQKISFVFRHFIFIFFSWQAQPRPPIWSVPYQIGTPLK